MESDRFNPFVSQVVELSRTLTNAKSQYENLTSSLAWFEGFKLNACSEQLATERGDLYKERQRMNVLKLLKKKQYDILVQDKKQTDLGFDPRYWFSSERSEAKRKYKNSCVEYEKLLTDEVELKRTIEVLEKSISHLEDEIERFQAFDCASVKMDLQNVVDEIATLEANVERASILKKEVYERQKELLKLLEQSERELSDVMHKVCLAKQCDRDLSSANNSYERAMIHKESEKNFGDGSPTKAVHRLQKRQSALENTIAKLVTRLTRIAELVSREIKTLIVDGNNLLYQGGDQFIGEAAVVALAAKILTYNYSLILVFDAGVNSLLKKGLQELESLFAKEVAIRIVSSRMQADDVLLNAADADPKTYVISNDKFRDYPDRKAVLEGRICEHIICNDVVQVPELGLIASFA